MNRLRWLTVLMGITILGITGFQLYWLKENYSREQKSLAIKTGVRFRETILQLQSSKLKLNGLLKDTVNRGKVKVFVSGGDNMQLRFTPREEIVSTINVISDKLTDSIQKNIKSGMVVSMDKSAFVTGKDSGFFDHGLPQPDVDLVFNMLYGVDSLQDSIRVKEIQTEFKKTLEENSLNVPFTISRFEGRRSKDKDGFFSNQVTIGFAKPVTYKLELGNTFPYILKQITPVVLFSVFLLGITILSFTLLYKSLLRQQRLAALKNEFISNITHELKTPIATVGVAIEALKNFNAIQDPQRTKEYLDISANELQRLSLLVDKVLKLSMFEKKEIELKYEPVNLKEIVEEVTNSMRLQLEKNHARVSITPEGDVGMQGDKLHLQSVIFNLMDNAIKYSKGEPTIQIGLKEQGDHIIMSVTDNGIGIPAEYKEKIFDKFFRIRHGDTHNAKGYGLGLSYVAHVVQKHKGTISVESQPDIGTKFIITLPKTPNP